METAHWELPEPRASLEVLLDGESSCIVRRHGNPQGRRLVLGHGNGLAIDMYYPFWSLLEEDYDLFVYDLRNHGRNKLTSDSDHNLLAFVRDLDCVLEAIDLEFGAQPMSGVFHSLSALIALLLSSELMALTLDLKSKGFEALVLFDPPLYRPGQSFEEFDGGVEKTARAARNRTERFSSREQYIELLNFLPAFGKLVPGAKELMARSLLKESPGGEGYRLRCPKSYEARIVEFIRAFAGEVDFESLPCPTKVIGSDPLTPYSYLPTLDLSNMVEIDFDFLPETTHLLQIEEPAECAAHLRDFLKRNRTA